MKAIFKTAGIVLANIIILLCIVMLINLGYAVSQDYERYADSEDERALLPSYDDHTRSKVIFREFNELDTQFVPFAGWSRLPYAGLYTTIGSEGDRVHPPLADSHSGEIHFFGGSTIWGTGASDTETIPAHFERLLPSYRAFNHGESGFNSRQSLARLIELYRQGSRPNLVVFYDGVNDVDHNCNPINGPYGHGRLGQFRHRIELPRTANAMAGSITEEYLWASRELWGEHFPETTNQSCHDSSEYAQQVTDGLFSTWKLAKQLVEANGGRFIGVLQAVAYVGSARVDYLEKLKPEEARAKNMQAVYPLIQNRIARERASGADWIFDFTDSFDGDQPLYVDYCHVTGTANLIVANRLSRLAQELLETD